MTVSATEAVFLTDFDLHLMGEGTHLHLYDKLGAHLAEWNGVPGVRFAVCGLSTRTTAQLIAQKTGGNLDAILKELTANLVPNARIVPAGIVTVSRAQERGYTFAYVD